MLKDLQWFKEQELSKIVCILPGISEIKEKKLVDVLNETDAVHYFEMQNRGYLFEKVIVVHKKVVDTCTTCEG